MKMSESKRIENIEEVPHLDGFHHGKLKQMAARNVIRWISEFEDPWAWKGIEYDEREGRYVATFDFDKIEEEKDNVLSGYIVATVRQFNLTNEDFEQALNEWEDRVREEIEDTREEIKELRGEDLSEEQKEELDRYERKLDNKETQIDVLRGSDTEEDGEE